MRAHLNRAAGWEVHLRNCRGLSVFAIYISLPLFVVAGTITLAADTASENCLFDIVKLPDRSPLTIASISPSCMPASFSALALSAMEPRSAIEAVKNQSDSEKSVITSYDLFRCDPEPYLRDIQKKERKLWNAHGLVDLGMAGFMFWGAMGFPGFSNELGSSPQNSDAASVAYIPGSIFLAKGFFELLAPTPAKSRLKKIEKITDLASRRMASFQALRSLQEEGMTLRLMAGIISATGAFIFIGTRPLQESREKSPWNYIIGGSLAFDALVDFLIRSPEESEYNSYMRAIGKKSGATLHAGVGLDHCRQLWIALQF